MLKKVILIMTPVICVFVLVSIAVSWISGNIILDYGRYFAVDQTGRVYLGVGYDIHVYEDSMPVNKFLVGRGIRFTIQNDEISAYDGSYTSRYTLDGKKSVPKRVDRADFTHNIGVLRKMVRNMRFAILSVGFQF